MNTALATPQTTPQTTTPEPTDETNTMSTSTTTTDTSTSARPKVTFGRLVRAEWLKLRTVKSTVWTLGGAAAAAVGLAALFTSLSDSGEGAPGPASGADDPLSLALAGFDLSVLIISILAVAMVAGEYQTGLIRTWFAATKNRVGTLLAKVGVVSATVFVLTTIAAVVAFVVGMALFPDASATLGLGDDGVWQAIAGTAFYAACIAAMGVAFGFLLRSTAAGAAAMVSLLMMAPLLVSLLPDSFSDPVGKILPGNAADAVSGLTSVGGDVLSTGWGIVTLLAWAGGSVLVAALALKSRDA